MSEKLLTQPDAITKLDENEHRDAAEYHAAQGKRAGEVTKVIDIEVKRRKADKTESDWSEWSDASDREIAEGVRSDLVNELAGDLFAASTKGKSMQEKIRHAELLGSEDEHREAVEAMNGAVNGVAERLTPNPTDFHKDPGAYDTPDNWENGTAKFSRDLVYTMVDVERELGLIEAPQELAAAA